MLTEELKFQLINILKEFQLEIPSDKILFEHPSLLEHGDYSTNLALMLSSSRAHSASSGQAPLGDLSASWRIGRNDDIHNPFELAQIIVNKWKEDLPEYIEKIEVANNGFINIWLNFNYFVNQIDEVINKADNYGNISSMLGRKIMIEFAHPNTHKELHIGHMRTLITGESLSRIFSANGAKVFRANYQGDIGPHVAKSIWGTKKILDERNMSWEEAEKLSLSGKAHLLGEGYVLGVKEYESFKNEIDELNAELYQKDCVIARNEVTKQSRGEVLKSNGIATLSRCNIGVARNDIMNTQILPIYERTRRWSLEYYDSFYHRFYTKFDRLFFESEIADEGKKIVLENIGNPPDGEARVFERSEGAVIFDGEKQGLHKRVFITADGNPTYEAKDIALAYEQYKAFPFDQNVHLVANEQTGYFQVMIKALETLDPSFKGKEFHLPMGMVNLVGQKMSSRTGVILKVDDLLDEVNKLLLLLIQTKGLSNQEIENIAETLTIAAVKYSVLKVNPKANVVFDLKKSVSLQGDSGIYLLYTYARIQSVLRKSKCTMYNVKCTIKEKISQLSEEETLLLRTFYRFPEIIEEAAREFSPNILCNFLFDLAQKFNNFYDKHRIVQSAKRPTSLKLRGASKTQSGTSADEISKNEPTEEQSNFRLILANTVGQVLKNGLTILGIQTVEKM